MRIPTSSLACVLVVAGLARAGAQGPEQVLLVVNGASPASQRVADAYRSVRAVPPSQVVTVRVPVADDLERSAYAALIETPVARAITRERLQDRVSYIVLSKDVPLRIRGTTGPMGSVGSVDSELALLYRKLTGRPVPSDGRVENPYYLGDRPVAQARAFSHSEFDIYLVTRLDGFSADDAMQLAMRGSQARNTGDVILDQRAGVDDIGNRWMEVAAARLGEMGHHDRVVLEQTSDAAGAREAIGYFSWGSADPAHRTRRPTVTFGAGAIGGSLVSTDARTLKPPPANWQPGDWQNRASHFAGSPQSLAGDLIGAGITGLAANVAEPLLDGLVRPQVLFPAWLSGFSLAESFYLAMPYLGWQGVVFGDPLAVLVPELRRAASTEPPVDGSTELPPWFAARRLAVLRVDEPDLAGAKAFLRGESRVARGDVDGAITAMRESVALAPKNVLGRRQLASLYEREQRWDEAIAEHRAVLDLVPRDVVALNNLAYAYGEHLGRPSDALPFAERAHALAPQDGNVADTLSWTYHLLGRHPDAIRLSTLAVSLSRGNAEILLNRATILSSTGDKPGAHAALDAALKLDPALASSARVVTLKAQLKVR